MFLDEAVIEVVSGAGGNGCVAFRREKHVPLGGPDGGNGGKGGDAILLVDPQVNTLLDFKYQKKFAAQRGGDGSGSRKYGANGDDVVIRVPVGTVVFDAVTGEKIADLITPGRKFVIAPGGRGGRGNLEFANAVRQTPTFAQKGGQAVEKTLKLELKMVADVGIIGLPNAGKSTLISAISAARPEIADYPFTTIQPNLGVVKAGDQSFVVADMPGLIEGAHLGVGLGDRFLRHIERTRILLHVVDAMPVDDSDPVANFDVVQHELKQYAAVLMDRPMIVALNKIDLPGAEEAAEEAAKVLRKRGHDVHLISAAAAKGTESLVFALARLLDTVPRVFEEMLPEYEMRAQRRPTEEPWSVERIDGMLSVIGPGVEKIVQQTDVHNFDALKHLHRKLERMGVIDALRHEGVEEGETVRIGTFELDFVETSK